MTGEGIPWYAQWLRLCAFTAGDMDSIPGWGTIIPYAVGPNNKGQKIQV